MAAHSRRVFAHPFCQRGLRLERKALPWIALIVIILITFVILAFWGQIPRLPHPQHQLPGIAMPMLSPSASQFVL